MGVVRDSPQHLIIGGNVYNFGLMIIIVIVIGIDSPINHLDMTWHRKYIQPYFDKKILCKPLDYYELLGFTIIVIV